jgi:fructoselysine-6-P-deglycase FrlB-like protein
MNSTEKKTAKALQHWATFRETMSQPAIWRSWTNQLVAHAETISAWVRSRGYTEIWFCGAGTSAFIGDTLSAYLNTPPRTLRCRSIPTTDLVSCPANFIRPDDRILVVSFGRSGTSPETIGCLDLLDTHLPDADRLHFTCNPTGALATRKPAGSGEQRVVLLPPETNDSGFAMTSSYSTMLLSALACLDEFPPLAIPEAFEQLADAVQGVLDSSILLNGDNRKPPARAVFLGSGVLAAAARESALKVLELAAGQIPTMWDSTLGFRHGPKAIVNDDTRVHVFVSNDPHTRKYDMDAANEIRHQYGKSSVTTFGSDKQNVDVYIPLIGNDAWSSVLYVAAVQIQSIMWSDALRINVDNPFSQGHLSRVVQGVPLYPFQPAV